MAKMFSVKFYCRNCENRFKQSFEFGTDVRECGYDRRTVDIATGDEAKPEHRRINALKCPNCGSDKLQRSVG